MQFRGIEIARGSMANNDIKSRLFDAIVEGPFETPLWCSFLDQLRKATMADFATLTFRPPGRPFDEEITLISSAEEVSVETLSLDEFPGEPPADERLIEGRPYSFNELFEMGDAQTVAYLSHIRDLGIGVVCQVRLQEFSGVHGWLTIARTGNEEFSQKSEALMQDTVTILRSALRFFVELERERFNASLTAESARRLHFGWLLLDRSGYVLDCDEQGAHILQASGAIRQQPNGRLSATPSKLEKEILQNIKRIADDVRSRPYAITLSHEPWYDMLLLPTRRKSISVKAAPAVIAYIHGDSWKSADRCEQLAQLFKLSPQESRLALSLCRGMTISEAASDLGLAIGTTRNYAKSIFAKTGARGQSDLVRILMRSVLAIAPEL